MAVFQLHGRLAVALCERRFVEARFEGFEFFLRPPEHGAVAVIVSPSLINTYPLPRRRFVWMEPLPRNPLQRVRSKDPFLTLDPPPLPQQNR